MDAYDSSFPDDDSQRGDCAVDEQPPPLPTDISSSVLDLHALAAYGELDSLEEQLRSCSSPSDPASLLALLNRTDELGLTLLHCAAQCGQQHVVDALLSLGADVCVRDASGRSPLHLASGAGSLHIVRSLLSSLTAGTRGCVDWQDISGCTALHWASRHNHDAVVQALIAAGASTEVKDQSGQTPSAAPTSCAFPTPVLRRSPPLTCCSPVLPLCSLLWTSAFKAGSKAVGARQPALPPTHHG